MYIKAWAKSSTCKYSKEKKKQQPELQSFYSCINAQGLHAIIFPPVQSTLNSLRNCERATVWETDGI